MQYIIKRQRDINDDAIFHAKRRDIIGNINNTPWPSNFMPFLSIFINSNLRLT